MKTASELLTRLSKLRSEYGGRDERYTINWMAYKGEYDGIFRNYAKDALGLPRQAQEAIIQKWNLVRPIVDTHRILINQMPTIQVPPPALGERLAAMKADKIEKVLYALYAMCDMDTRHGEAAFNVALNWSSVFQVGWDEELEIPICYVRSPGETYPVMKRGGEEVSYCFFYWTEDSDELAENYPQAKPLLTRNNRGASFSGDVEVAEYVDSATRAMIIGGEVKQFVPDFGGDHDLKHCPVFLCSGSNIPGEVFPPGPVDQLPVMNDHLNRFQTKLAESIEETMFGWHDLIGEGAKDEVVATGPGAINRYETGILHQYTQPQAPPSQAFGHIDQVQRYMRNIANWPEVASGEMDSSIITGKAVSRLQGIMAAQAAECQQNIGKALQKVNSTMLQMMETYRGDKKFVLYATDGVTLKSAPGKPAPYEITCIPNEDIQGYYRNTLNYSPFGSDMNASLQIGMQLVDSRIWSRQHLRNLIPGTSDAEGEALQIEEEDRRRMEMEIQLQTQAQQQLMETQAKMQQQAQAAQQTSGGPGAQSAPAAQPQSAPTTGGLPPQGQPPAGQAIGGSAMLMPGGQPQALGIGEPMTGTEGFPIPYSPLKPYGPALAALAGTGTHGEAANAPPLGVTPGANAITLKEVQEIFSGIQKLKGSVFVMGDIVAKGYTDGSVEVGLTNPVDKATISNAVRNTKLYGRITFSSTIPTTGTVQVAGPKAA